MRFRSKKKAEIWSDTNIPAGLFFDILSDDQVYKLVKDIPRNRKRKRPKKEYLTHTFDLIFDEYFASRNDPEMKLILKLKKSLLMQGRRMQLIRIALENLALHDMPRANIERICEGLKQVQVIIEPGNRADVLRALKTDLGVRETKFKLDQDALSKLTDKEKRTYEQNCVTLEEHGYQVREGISLKKYMAYEKGAELKVQKHKENARRQTHRGNKQTGNRGRRQAN